MTLQYGVIFGCECDQYGLDLLRTGRADAIIAGGAEACVMRSDSAATTPASSLQLFNTVPIRLDTTDFEAKVIQFIASKVENVDISTISTASKFEELGFDSLDTVQLLFDAEETFGISFDGEEVKSLRSVGDIIDYISKHPPVVSS